MYQSIILQVRVTAPEGTFAASSALKVGDAAGTKLGLPEARSATLGSLLKLAHVRLSTRKAQRTPMEPLLKRSTVAISRATFPACQSIGTSAA